MSPTLLAYLRSIAYRTTVSAQSRDIAPQWRELLPVSDFYRPAELHARGLTF